MGSNGFRDEAMFRVGASVLGMFAGFVIALLAFTPLAILGWVAKPLPHLLFAGAASGLLCGVLIPGVSFLAFEGVVHFFAGLFIAFAGGDFPSSEDSSRWLYAAAWLGVLYFGGIWLGLHILELFGRYP